MIYLDNAATTYPKPEVVYEKTFRFIRESMGNPGRGGHALSVAAGAVLDEARRRVARFFAVRDPRQVVFTAGCTDSINIALKGLLLPGDHVVVSSLDHNAVSRPVEELRSSNVHVTRVAFDECGRADIAAVANAITSATRLLVLTHGSNVLGVVQPLEPFLDLARSYGVPLLLDAAQTAGRIPIQQEDAQLLIASSGHKGLYGMPGVGILTVPEGMMLRKWRTGGTGTGSESLQHPDDMPMRLEAGTPASPSIASLLYGIEFLETEGIAKIHQVEMNLVSKLAEFLESDDRFVIYPGAGCKRELAVVSFKLRKVGTQEVAAILDQNFGIAVRAGLHCAAVLHSQQSTVPDGLVRVSPGYFNTEQEIDTLISALRQIADAFV